MKKIIHCLIFLGLFVCSGFSQSNSTDQNKVNNDKYRINLPDYWRPGNKVWQILIDKLPIVAEELKDKQICGDNCKPKYTIEFEMSEPEVIDYQTHMISRGNNRETWEINTLYTFSSSLYLFDENDRILTRFILVDTNEVWKVTNRTEFEGYAMRPPMKIYVLKPPYNQGTDAADWARNQNPYGGGSGMATSPYNYINNNKDKLGPTQRNMLDVVDGKFRSW